MLVSCKDSGAVCVRQGARRGRRQLTNETLNCNRPRTAGITPVTSISLHKLCCWSRPGKDQTDPEPQELSGFHLPPVLPLHSSIFLIWFVTDRTLPKSCFPQTCDILRLTGLPFQQKYPFLPLFLLTVAPVKTWAERKSSSGPFSGKVAGKISAVLTFTAGRKYNLNTQTMDSYKTLEMITSPT